jgi:hypothetical protein
MKIYNSIISSKFESLFHYLNDFNGSVEVFKKNLIAVSRDEGVISIAYPSKQRYEIVFDIKDMFLQFDMSFNIKGIKINDSVTFGDIIKDNEEIEFPYLDEKFIDFLDILIIKIEKDLLKYIN